MNPWVIVAEIGITIGLWAINKWLTDVADTRAKYLQDAPTANEGSPVSIVIGRRRVANAFFAWYGGFRARGPISFGSIEQLEGTNNYGVNMLVLLGVGLGPATQPHGSVNAKLWAIYVGDKRFNFALADQDTILLDDFTLAGTSSTKFHNGLGLTGQVQFFAGGTDQLLSNNVASAPTDHDTFTDLTEIAWFMRRAFIDGTGPDPREIPGYRNQLLVSLTGRHDAYFSDPSDNDFWDAFYFGQDPHIPQLSFEVSSYRIRYNSGWQALQDADPAAVIYDLLTESWGKLNIDPALIDDSSFGTASNVLLGEKLGYSRVIDAMRDGREVLQEVVNHICAALYQDPVDGKIHLRLLRAGDAFAATYGESDVIDLGESSVGSWRPVINQVRVKYYDRSLDYREASAVAQNSGSAVMQGTYFGDVTSPGGNVRSVTIEYPGCCTYAQAVQLAQRDLSLLSVPLQKGRFTFGRSARVLRPGDTFRLTMADVPTLAHGVTFRVVGVDLGQPGSEKVVVDCIQDVFSVGQGAGYSPPASAELFIPEPSPITLRKVTEEPRWMLNYLKGTGAVSDPDVQRIMACAAPDDGAGRYSTADLAALAAFAGVTTFSPDVALTVDTTHGFVNAAYAREAGPYDTTTGLLVDSLPAFFGVLITGQIWTHSQISTYGYNLVLVGDEMIAYESVTDTSGTGVGPWRLNNVWRGVLDTAPADHAIGEDVWWVGTAFALSLCCGRSGWADNVGPVNVKMSAELGLLVGSGDDSIDVVTIKGRHDLPQRVANFRVCGQVMTGTVLRPTVAAPAGSSGMFGKATGAEEGIGFDFTIRSRTIATITRGDEGGESASDAQTYEVVAQKVAAQAGEAIGGSQTMASGLAAGDTLAELRLGQIGYGDVDLSLHSRLTSTSETEWSTPKVRVRLERWRNLLGNVRWQVHGAGTNLLPHWTGTNTPTIVAGTTSIGGISSGLYAETVGGTGGTYVQTVDVTDFLPRGMDAWCEVYMRANTSAPTTKINVKVEALDAASASLGSVNTDFGSIPTTAWKVCDVVYSSLPANTTQIKLTFTFSTDLTQPQIFFCEPRLRLGQFTRDVLANGSFESASTASWTNGLNSFVADTTAASPSANYARGGAFSSSEIYQEYTLPTGWEVGSDAILTCWRFTSKPNDTGEVVMESKDSLGNTLSTAKTGLEDLSGLGWVQRRLSLPLPEGTTKVRITLHADRTALGTSGAMFDEIRLSLAKDQSDPREYHELKFYAPSAQPIAATWQQWHVEQAALYRAGVPHPIVFAGLSPSKNGFTNKPINMTWSDGVSHVVAQCVGQWGGTAIQGIFPTTTLNGYATSRGGVDYETFGEDGSSRHMSPTSSTPFTVIAFFRVDEDVLSAACGIVGRRGSTGWGLELDASGQLKAVLAGTSATVTATRAGSNCADGGWHLAAMIFDGSNITVVDDRGNTTTSAASIGEIANTDETTAFRIGRASDAGDSLPGMIARVYWFDAALTLAQVNAHWTYGDDPTGLGVTFPRSGAAWVPAGRDSAGNEMLACLATDQAAVCYSRDMAFDDLKMGLALGTSTTNLIPSFDLSTAAFNSTWTVDGGGSVNATTAIVDATGKARGISLINVDTTHGLVLKGITGLTSTGAGANSLVFWAKSASGTPTLAVELLDDFGVSKSTKTVAITTLWRRYVANFTGWDASTGTARIRFKSNAGTIAFSLTHVMHLEGSPNVPFLIPRLAAGSISSDSTATLSATLSKQLNAEGEVLCELIGANVTPGVAASIVSIDNGSDDKNRRELRVTSAEAPTFDHYDSAGANVSSATGAVDMSQDVQMRGRWAYTKTLDNAANAFAGLVTAASVNGTNYGRSANWTYDATQGTRIRIGIGSQPAPHALVHRVIVRAREQKLV